MNYIIYIFVFSSNHSMLLINHNSDTFLTCNFFPNTYTPVISTTKLSSIYPHIVSRTPTTSTSVAPTTSVGIGTDEGGPNSASQSVLIIAGGAATVAAVVVGLTATAVVIMEAKRKRKRKSQQTESGERKRHTNHVAATGIFSVCVCVWYVNMWWVYSIHVIIKHQLSCLFI